MASIIDLLEHLSPKERKELEEIEDRIFELQGNLRTQEDTIKLSELYKQRYKILKWKRRGEHV